MRSKAWKRRNIFEWHFWFAWYPVIVSDVRGFKRWVWWEKVGRIRCYGRWYYELYTK